MPVFKDQSGREWLVEINVWTIRQVRERAAFEIGRLLEDDLKRWAQLAAEPELFGAVLFVLCADQATNRNVSEREFHTQLAGDALEGAHEAFREAFLNFCPSQQRKLLLAATQKGEAVQKELSATALRGIEAIDPTEAAATLSGSAGSSAESSGSTPAPAG